MGSTRRRGEGRFISVKYGQTCHHLFSGTNRSSPNGLQKSRDKLPSCGSVTRSLLMGFYARAKLLSELHPQLQWGPNRSDRDEKAFCLSWDTSHTAKSQPFCRMHSYADMNYGTLTQCHIKTLTKCHSTYKLEIIQMENILTR